MMPHDCGCLHRRQRAVKLGQAFAKSFANNSANVGKGEVALFQAMQKSLLALANPPNVVVEEYHGTQHQVTFTGSGTYSRTNARCELSDLLIVVYDCDSKYARLTYIQAKSERNVPASPCGIAGKHLGANLEQWDLLARRPPIRGVGTFKPPSDLLCRALLPSIGSFVFFIHGCASVDIYYCAASWLTMPYPYSTRAGKLTAVGNLCLCHHGAPIPKPPPECVSVYGNAEFGAFLFGMMIGEPILIHGTPQRAGLASWLAAQLRGLAARADRKESLAGELADLLAPQGERAQEPNVGAATLLLFGLKSDGRLD